MEFGYGLKATWFPDRLVSNKPLKFEAENFRDDLNHEIHKLHEKRI